MLPVHLAPAPDVATQVKRHQPHHSPEAKPKIQRLRLEVVGLPRCFSTSALFGKLSWSSSCDQSAWPTVRRLWGSTSSLGTHPTVSPKCSSPSPYRTHLGHCKGRRPDHIPPETSRSCWAIAERKIWPRMGTTTQDVVQGFEKGKERPGNFRHDEEQRGKLQ